jgi:hypothetical protein
MIQQKNNHNILQHEITTQQNMLPSQTPRIFKIDPNLNE